MRWVVASSLILALAVIWFTARCLADLARAGEVRYFTQWQWAIICVISMPLGGIFYLQYGKVR